MEVLYTVYTLGSKVRWGEHPRYHPEALDPLGLLPQPLAPAFFFKFWGCGECLQIWKNKAGANVLDDHLKACTGVG